MEAIYIALISGFSSAAAAIAVTVIQNRKTVVLLEYRLKELEKKVDKHNNLVERTYDLEARADVSEEKIKTANNRIDDLERRENK